MLLMLLLLLLLVLLLLVLLQLMNKYHFMMCFSNKMHVRSMHLDTMI